MSAQCKPAPQGGGYRTIPARIRERSPTGWQERPASDRVSEECPVALVYNGVSHAVMMASPLDLADFALGFSLSEGILQGPEELFAVEPEDQGELGLSLHLHIHGQRMAELRQHRRNLAGPTGCGLCGLEQLAQIQPPPAAERPAPAPDAASVHRALVQLDHHQRLQQLTGTLHAACWCDSQGAIHELREDVGRHNALDKLIGALAASGRDTRGGFALVSSRGSYEMVAKAARARLGTLVTVSGVTALAIRDARRARLNLIGFARRGRQVVYVDASTKGGQPS